MFEAGSFCPFGITRLLPICPTILGTVHRQVPVFMTALKFSIIYMFIILNLFVDQDSVTKGSKIDLWNDCA